MRRRTRYNTNSRAVRGMTVLLLVSAAVKFFSYLYDSGVLKSSLEKLMSNEGIAEAIITMETGSAETEASDAKPIVLSPVRVGDTDYSASPLERVPDKHSENRVFCGILSSENLAVKNYSEYSPDYDGLLNSGIDISQEGAEPLVLIYHTHSTEAYSMTEDTQYEESDPYRTIDPDNSVIRVGTELVNALESYGIVCVHDMGLYDYPSYNGSYSRSLESVEKWLSEYPSVKLVLDIHRDAAENEDGSAYKTVSCINGESAAQIMLVAGTDASGLQHPDWEQNLSLALKLQYAMDALYPSLSRPINLSAYRYNQDVSPGSLIIEVGTNGNTLTEALRAIRAFADCVEETVHAW